MFSQFSSELSRNNHQHDESYPTYKPKDIESVRVVKLGPVRHELGQIVRHGQNKKVLIRRYNDQVKKVRISCYACVL